MIDEAQQDRTIKVGAIVLSLLLNSGALIYFLLLQKMNSSLLTPPGASEASIILQEPTLSKPPTPAPLEEWAQTYASQSHFGLPPETQEIDETALQTETEQEISSTPISPTQQDNKDEELPLSPGAQTLTTSVVPAPTALPEKTIAKPKRNQLPSTRQQTSRAPKKLTVGDLAKGFLDHMKENGNHSITMMGKKGAVPNAQQLQHERYLQKINWCLQNTFRINKDKMPLLEPQILTSKIVLELNKDGSLRTLALVETCGVRIIDRFTLFLFKEASSSFPPVPDYLPHDPYRITYKIEVGTDGSVPLGLFR